MRNPALGAFIQRILFSLLFIIPGVMHILNWNETIQTTSSVFGSGTGAIILSVGAVVFMVFGGFSILLGKKTTVGGWMLTLFLIGGAYVHFTFSQSASSLGEEQMQMAHLMKNMALMGVAIRYALGGSLRS